MNNKYFKYKFFSEKFPTKMTLHAVSTHFLGKEECNFTDFKVFNDGKNIIILTDKNIDKESFSILLRTEKGIEFKCHLVKKEENEILNFNIGDKVEIFGKIEYGVHITNKKGKKCPFFLGRFESDDLRKKFKKHIEDELGVKILKMENRFFSRLISEKMSEKFQFNNTILIDSLPLEIVDNEKFKKIQYKSFFQKKTFGFGDINIKKLLTLED